MSEQTNSAPKKGSFRGFLIFGVIILGSLLAGFITGEEQFVLDIFKTIGLMLLGITILVTIHELGHFLTARMFGMRVDTFSIGFPPKIFSIKKGDTEYQVGATPLGGYVKIAGMIDESLDDEFIEREKAREAGVPGEFEARDYEFRSKPVWQRMIVMSGGVIMNILLGILIFSMFKWTYGDTHLPLHALKNGVLVFDNTIGEKLGFQTGDMPVAYNGEELQYLDEFTADQITRLGYYTVKRGGSTVDIPIPATAINWLADKEIINALFIPDIPPYLTMDTSSVAYKAGLRKGDKLLTLDSVSIPLFSDIIAYLQGPKIASGNRNIAISYEREGKILQTSAVLDSAYKLNIGSYQSEYFKGQTEHIAYSFFEAFGPGTAAAFGVVRSQAQGLVRLAEPQVETRKLLQGPIRIANALFDLFEADGWRGFLRFTGVLSMILALMNILPIPALDGGHLVFLIYEGITRREPSLKVRMIAQQVGLLLVLGLMAFVIFNDAIQSFFN